MTQNEIELHILRRYTDQHKNAELQSPGSKCARELDMRDVLAALTGEAGQELQYSVELWLDRLAPRNHASNGPLRRCSDSAVAEKTHKGHARAYRDSGSGRAPAWDRIRELEALVSSFSKSEIGLWKRLAMWLLKNLGKILIGVITGVFLAWALIVWGPHEKALTTTPAEKSAQETSSELALESYYSLWEKVGTNCGFPNYSPLPLEGTEIHLKVGQRCTLTPTVMSAHPSHTLKGTFVMFHFPREMQYEPLQRGWINDGRDGDLVFREMIGVVPPTARPNELYGNSALSSLILFFNEARRYTVTYQIRASDGRGFKPILGEFYIIVEDVALPRNNGN